MPTFKLPETELAEMKMFYEAELNKTIKKLQHLSNVLNELGAGSNKIEIRIGSNVSDSKVSYSTETIDTPVRRRGRPPGTGSSKAVAKTPKADKQKPGRKSIWETVVLNRLEQLNRPFTYDELTQEIMTFSNLKESKRKSTKQALLNVAFRLRSRDKKIDTFSVGSREKYIALTSWFDSNGRIKPEYYNMVADSAPVSEAAPVKAEPKKRGRKPKVVTSATGSNPEQATAKRRVGRPRKLTTAPVAPKTAKPGKKRGRKPKGWVAPVAEENQGN